MPPEGFESEASRGVWFPLGGSFLLGDDSMSADRFYPGKDES
jgi:hypothetical protein